MKKVLIANIFGIGDVLNTTPLVGNLKKLYGAEISIDYLCNARAKPIVENIPDINSVFVYEKDDFVSLWKKSKWQCLREIFKLFGAIKEKRYDTVLDFTLSREFGFLFMLSGIPCRAGLSYKKRGIFLEHKVPFKAFTGKHVVEYYFDVLRCLDIPVVEKNMRLVPDEKNRVWAENYLREKNIDSKRFVAIVPGGGASWGEQAQRRRWNPENFSRVADILSENSYQVIFIGDDSEKELCNTALRKMKMSSAITENSLTLKQYVALLNESALVLCNDGGPLHITTALNVKGVFVFGPVDDKVYGPYPVSRRHISVTADGVECRPCYYKFRLPECEHNKKCLTEIRPEQVAEKCLELLET
ncbi:MAG: glycosyltransferase family 9 protein [Candidatus Omnitrophota bacterium]